MEKVITRTCEIFLNTDRILYIRLLKELTIDLDDAIDNFLVARNMAAQQPMLQLMDCREKTTITREARRFMARANIRGQLAKAILVDPLPEKYIQAVYQSLINPKLPVNCFTSEEAALRWLKAFL